eukprot:CAMPEP_0172511498 /NCGR_PEP_ID=MMETSP1066-20121228/236956_1 /TAXON_ID=671091 /ORGANISM="Coscinodiscus wailesii, Strain CCMP2513" /LENGTH=313 /DNA_ID=CAMNT_0013290901 /DNA_START=60 /DNA_END=1001 /DNA_ORIENTATION=+
MTNAATSAPSVAAEAPISAEECAAAASPKRQKPNYKKRAKILLLGDSLTQLSFDARNDGFGAALAHVYQRRADVFNRGFAGYNTDWFLQILDTPAGSEDVFGSGAARNGGGNSDNVVLVTIFFGANDASDEVLNPRHHVPIDRYKSNLKKIVTLSKTKCPDARILIIAPPPVHHEGRLSYQKRRYGDKATGKLERNMEISGQYARGAEEVAQEVGVPCLNLWDKMQSSDENWGSKYFYDGLHFSKEGNALVGQLLLETISQHFPELKVVPCGITGYWGNSASVNGEHMPKIAPWHDEIDYTKPEEAFVNHYEN